MIIISTEGCVHWLNISYLLMLNCNFNLSAALPLDHINHLSVAVISRNMGVPDLLETWNNIGGFPISLGTHPDSHPAFAYSC